MNFIFDNDRPIYIQLVEQLKQQIVSGKGKTGERLLSVRELAILTKVNPNTMQKALVELENEKLIYTERTNGKIRNIYKDESYYILFVIIYYFIGKKQFEKGVNVE